MDYKKISAALDRIHEVLKEPAEKKYKIRVDVTLEVSQTEFCNFLLSRELFHEFLLSEGKITKLDTEFFRAMLEKGCTHVMRGITKIMLDSVSREKQAEEILDMIKKAHEEFHRKTKEN
jgi:hypothetical protein